MIAKLVFTVLLLGIALYAWREYRRAPVVGLSAMIAALAGLYFVLAPSHASWLAAWAGVGRGVDLVIYVWVAISLILLLNLHLKMRAQMELITILARSVAIENAARSQKPGPHAARGRANVRFDGTAKPGQRKAMRASRPNRGVEAGP